jgi:hypothetical protein
MMIGQSARVEEARQRRLVNTVIVQSGKSAGQGLESCVKRGRSGRAAPGADFGLDYLEFTTKRRFFPVYQNPARTYIMRPRWNMIRDTILP